MKKIIVGMVVALFAGLANAEYLYWSVGSTYNTYVSGTDYTAARLMATTDGSNYSEIDYIASTPDKSYANLGSTQYANFYIELFNYSNEQTYRTETIAYSNLSDAVFGSMESLASVKAVWMGGSTTVATPEPTSGLLMLMGFAMLGLKRKKEV